MSYKASSNSSGINPYNYGAGQCFDCHETQNASTTSSGKPWGYLSTFGATDPIMGYKDTSRFGTGVKASQARTGYTYKNGKAMMGGHLKRTLQGQSGQATVALQHTPEAQISGACTPCHDPHGVSPALGADMAYGVPLLKGTWMTSPYKDEAAPNNSNIVWEQGTNNYSAVDAPGHRIDQNTFAAWSWSSKTKISETVDQFAGLCIKCHPQNKSGNGIDKDASGAWRSMDRIHDTVKGWGGNGQNAGNAIHAFPCAKCHQPHVSGLPRLMTTNCIDYNHKGKVASGGVASRKNYSGKRGSGGGTFPSGGRGNGQNHNNTLRGFQGGYNNLLYCHDSTNADAFPTIEKWNTLIGW